MFQLQLFFLLHCDEWDRVVALPRHKYVTGATLLQLTKHYTENLRSSNSNPTKHGVNFGRVSSYTFVVYENLVPNVKM
jgi:uncharacterized protein YmfQ (DUF2313 family)